MSKIAARQVIYVGYRETAFPFSYLPPHQSEPLGYGIDLCAFVVKAVAASLGKPLRVVPVSMTDNARAMMLKTGMVDLDCSLAGNTVARQRQVALTHNVYVSEIRVMTKKTPALSTLGALAEKRVVTVLGSTAERQIKEAALKNGVNLQHVLASSPAEAMALLSKGDVEAFAGEDVVLASQRALSEGDYVLLNEVLAFEPYAIMLPKDDAAWKTLVDVTLDDLMQQGEIDRLYSKWFTSPLSPGGRSLDLPMPEKLREALRVPNDTPVN